MELFTCLYIWRSFYNKFPGFVRRYADVSGGCEAGAYHLSSGFERTWIKIIFFVLEVQHFGLLSCIDSRTAEKAVLLFLYIKVQKVRIKA